MPQFRYLQAERDFHFSALILRLRQARTRGEKHTAYAVHSFWIAFDRSLPKRWQIADEHLNSLIELFFLFPIDDLAADVQRYDTLRTRLRPVPKPEHRREIYQTANRLMKPLLKPMGYRSLAEFEQAYEDRGEKMLWPKSKGATAGGR